MTTTQAQTIESRFDWQDALKRLAKALVVAVPVAVLMSGAIAGFATLLNLGFSITFLIYSGLAGKGHTPPVLLPVAMLPFLPFFAVELVVAHRLGIKRVVAAAVESQGVAIVWVGERVFRTFMAEQGQALRQSKSGRAFNRAWEGYLRTRAHLPWAVTFLLSRLCAKTSITELLDSLAERGVADNELPREFMTQVLSQASRTMLRPAWKPALLLFMLNVLWFAMLMVLLLHGKK
ncbi:MAG TPA: hypothetical protein VIV60_17580 [Polyangiaceae bacterium]